MEHTAPGVVEYCIVNTGRIPEEMLMKYKGEESYPVVPDSENIKKMKCKVIEAHIISTEDYVRHDSAKLARIIIDLIAGLRRSKA
jgi:hypothetical protein